MPATRSRTSTEQPAEVAAEEVKQVQAEDSSEIVSEVPVSTDVVKSAETGLVPESAAAEAAAAVPDVPAADPVVPAAADAVLTNGSAEPVAESNGSSEATNGTAVTNGTVAAEAAVQQESVPEAAAELPVASEGKRKSEVGDGDVVPDSTDVKKQKVLAEDVAEEQQPVVDASA